jgi:hypothetical protein
MVRMSLAALLALAALAADAQQAGQPFKVATLGEAAARVQDLADPLTLEVHIPLTPSREFPLESLHAYLTRHGFAIEVQTRLENGQPVPGAPMTMVARKHAVMSEQDIDGYSAELTRLLPKDTSVSWRFAVPKSGTVQSSVPSAPPAG